MIRVVNVGDCELTESVRQGDFEFHALPLREPLGATWFGAAVYGLEAGHPSWPYHEHHGVEEWLYVVSGAPRLRTTAGERSLAPGELVAFPQGPAGAHGVSGPGRIVMFSIGDRGFGEAHLSVYPDSDKVGAAPGIQFRRADAIEVLGPEAPATLGGELWAAHRHALAPGEAAGPYRYEWCRESWALVTRGAITLRDADGERPLRAGDLAAFPPGPEGAGRLTNDGAEVSELLRFTTPVGRPWTAFEPDAGEVVIRASGAKGWRFRLADAVPDYWDGEPRARGESRARG